MRPAYFPHDQWALFLGAAICLWSYYWVKPNFGAFAAGLLGYLSLSSIFTWVFVENRYLTINPYDQMALRYFSTDSIARMLIILVPLFLFSERKSQFELAGNIFFKMFLYANSMWVLLSFLIHHCKHSNSCGGIGNPSIIIGASVCMLPAIVPAWRKEWYLVALVAISVLLSKSSVALGLLGVYLAYLLLQERLYWLVALLAPLPLIAGHFMLGDRMLFSSGDRFMIWSYMMPKWATWQNLPFGTGFGTYHVFSINLQAVQKVASGSYWNTLHNDWLQMLFEGGVIGGMLMVGTYFSALYRTMAREKFSIAMSILLFGIYLGVNPGLHHAIPSLFGAWLFICALKRAPLNFYEGEIYA